MLLNISIIIVTTALVVVSLLLILLVLMQRPKQEGLGAAFGAGVTDQIWGAQTTNVLQKGTVFMGVLLFLLSLTLAMLKAAESRIDTGLNLKSDKPAVVEQEKPAASTPATANSSPITIPAPGGSTSPITITPAPVTPVTPAPAPATPPADPSPATPPAETPAVPPTTPPADAPPATPPAEAPATPPAAPPADGAAPATPVPN